MIGDRNPGLTFQGHRCTNCGAWVYPGTMHWCSQPYLPSVATTIQVPCSECAENRKRIEALEARLKALGAALAEPESKEET